MTPELEQAQKQAQKQAQEQAPRKTQAPRARSKIWKAAIGVVASVGIGLLLLWFLPTHESEPSFHRTAVLPAAGIGASPMEWALSAWVGEYLAASDGVRLVPLPRASLLDRDLGVSSKASHSPPDHSPPNHSPLGLSALAKILGVDSLLLLEVVDGEPSALQARLHWPATGEVRSLPEQGLVLDKKPGLEQVARWAAHEMGPGVLAADTRAAETPVDLDAPEVSRSLTALGRALAAEAAGDLGRAAQELRAVAATSHSDSLKTPFLKTLLLETLARLELASGDRQAARHWTAAARGPGEGRPPWMRQRLRALELEAEGRLENAARTLAQVRGERPADLELALWEIRLLLSAALPDEARKTLESVVPLLPGELATDPRLELARAAIAGLEGDTTGQLAAALRAADIAGDRGDWRQRSLALLDVGAALVADGDLAAALEKIEEARSLALDLGAPGLLARCDNANALTLALAGERQAAEDSFALALEGFRGLGLRGASAAVLMNRGRVRQRWEDDGAAEDLQRAGRLYEELGDETGRQRALRALARLEGDH